MRLLLVRHGETDSNVEGRSQGRRDVPLNDHGRQQAAAVGEWLRSADPVAVYASPSQRAQDTAGAIAAACGLAVSTDERLAELDQGDLDGLTPPEMRERDPEFLRRWMSEDPAKLTMPGGESLGDSRRRMLAAARDIVAAHSGGQAGSTDVAVVAVSHNLALKSLLCEMLGVPLASFRGFRIDVASVSTIDVLDDGTFLVVNLNERCHIDRPD
jgi:probable phosphoglycerate mutase